MYSKRQWRERLLLMSKLGINDESGRESVRFMILVEFAYRYFGVVVRVSLGYIPSPPHCRLMSPFKPSYNIVSAFFVGFDNLFSQYPRLPSSSTTVGLPYGQAKAIMRALIFTRNFRSHKRKCWNLGWLYGKLRNRCSRQELPTSNISSDGQIDYRYSSEDARRLERRWSSVAGLAEARYPVTVWWRLQAPS